MNLVENDKSARILVIDDEFSIRDSLTKWFKEDGYEVEAIPDAEQTLEKLQPGRWDVVIIMITAYATVDTAVRSLKEGAYDYVTKPVDPDYLSHLVATVMERRSLLFSGSLLQGRVQELYEIDQMVGDSPTMSRIFEMIETVAATDTTVMIKGEGGTGKELIARAIHAKSLRRFYPFIAINCGALSQGSAKSEFFGHEKGTFPDSPHRRRGKFEMANGGTVFLDEVGNIDAEAQADLLRLIETKQFTRLGGDKIINVDVRLISATNQDLELAIKEGDFREDLFYKLNVFSLTIPPLRERRSDIPLFCNYFLKKIAGSMNKPMTGFSAEAWDRLRTYDWPGNVRELRNAIERAIVVARDSGITVDDLPIPRTQKAAPEDEKLRSVEKAHILNVLEQTGWNITRSAQMLRIDRVTLYNKMKKYGVRKKP
jgi:DNA-binding NtrC family response regulator